MSDLTRYLIFWATSGSPVVILYGILLVALSPGPVWAKVVGASFGVFVTFVVCWHRFRRRRRTELIESEISPSSGLRAQWRERAAQDERASDSPTAADGE